MWNNFSQKKSRQTSRDRLYQIATSDDIDLDFWFQSIQRRLLPQQAHVREFNKHWTNDPQRPRFLGLYACSILTDARNQMAIQLMRTVRAVVITCEPLGRVEKHFYTGFCKTDGTSQSHLYPGTTCTKSIAHALSAPAFLDSLFIGEHLLDMVDLFGSRLMLVHQESLRIAPEATYNKIARFLGASKPFPAETLFQRYNSQRGHRTDLCQNSSLVDKFKRRLSHEYQAIASALLRTGETPPHNLRQTRCERVEELDETAPHCDTWTPCTS